MASQEEEDRRALAQQRAKAVSAAAANKRRIQDQTAIRGGATDKTIFSGSGAQQAGQMAGLSLANNLYGEGIDESGVDVQRLKLLQEQRTAQSGGDPVSAAIMGQKATAVANAQRGAAASGVKGGSAMGAISGIERAQNQDIAASLYGQQRTSLQDEVNSTSNRLSGKASLMSAGGAGKDIPSAPKQDKGMTVICTELHRQGIMSSEIYEKDVEYGKALEENYPHVMIGYTFLATPIVKWMQKSKIFTEIVAYPAMKWAKHIADEKKSVIGYLVFYIGQPICGVIGKLITKGTSCSIHQ